MTEEKSNMLKLHDVFGVTNSIKVIFPIFVFREVRLGKRESKRHRPTGNALEELDCGVSLDAESTAQLLVVVGGAIDFAESDVVVGEFSRRLLELHITQHKCNFSAFAFSNCITQSKL